VRDVATPVLDSDYDENMCCTPSLIVGGVFGVRIRASFGGVLGDVFVVCRRYACF
jgi:hypothetical protein